MSLFEKKSEKELEFDSYKKILQKGLVKYKNRKFIEYKLAKCYMYGLGVKINHKEAIYYLKLSSNEGHMEAQYYLSDYYEKGKHIGKDLNEAFILCKKSAEQNYDKAQYKMGIYYDYMKEDEDKYFTKDIKEAFNWYKKSAEQGFVKAQHALASCYDTGDGVVKNQVEAFIWYKKAAEQNHVKSQCDVGTCYENGEGVEKNMVEALSWYKKSAEQGYYKAQYNIGLFYEYGLGNLVKNLDEAFKYYKKSENYGYCKAQHKLANCYKYEKGTPKNLKLAFILYEKAINSGCNCACTYYQYALCYENGEGVEADINKAFTLYKKSVELGCSNAHYKLAEFYKYGKGTQINIKEADNLLFIVSKKLGYNKPDNLNTYCIDYQDAEHDAAFEENCTKTQTLENPECKAEEKQGADTELQDKIIESKNIISISQQIVNNLEKDIFNKKQELEINKKKKLNYEKELGIANTILENNKIEYDYTKLELKDILSFYEKNLKLITDELHSNDMYFHTYNESDDIYTNKINSLYYLKYNYQCGVLNHKLGNYEEAIKYYEEAAYNKYPLAQKALAYCYKHGIYYEKSLEKYKIWYNLYMYKYIVEDID